jgi:hypothetical protein
MQTFPILVLPTSITHALKINFRKKIHLDTWEHKNSYNYKITTRNDKEWKEQWYSTLHAPQYSIEFKGGGGRILTMNLLGKIRMMHVSQQRLEKSQRAWTRRIQISKLFFLCQTSSFTESVSITFVENSLYWSQTVFWHGAMFCPTHKRSKSKMS